MSCYGYQERLNVFFEKKFCLCLQRKKDTIETHFVFFFKHVTSCVYACGIISGMSGLANVNDQTNFIFKLKIIIALLTNLLLLLLKYTSCRRTWRRWRKFWFCFLYKIDLSPQVDPFSTSPLCTGPPLRPHPPFPSKMKHILKETLPY